jgi:hypothetical protein
VRLVKIFSLSLVLLLPQVAAAQRADAAAARAWRPFFDAFRAAVKRRDREAVRRMMIQDFYFHSSGGDDNGDDDTRDEAFEFWDEPRVRGWEALERVLAQGTVPNTAMREPGNRRPSRVGPPAANNRRAIQNASFEWYAVFEFRDGRWYCTVFNQCCD